MHSSRRGNILILSQQRQNVCLFLHPWSLRFHLLCSYLLAPSCTCDLHEAQRPKASSATTKEKKRNLTPSRARSLSPTKKTQSLGALKKPIHHVALQDNATEQLPADVRDLYNRIYEITVEHESIFPWQARDEIIQATGRKFKDSWFYGKDKTYTSGGKGEPAVVDGAVTAATATAALAELSVLREIEDAAWECRDQGRSEAAWNMEVHGPLLKLGVSGHRRVRRELITTAQITKAFVPPMDGYAVGDYADRKMVDFALVLDPAGGSRRGEGDLPPAEDADTDRRLADAIRRTVYGQPHGRTAVFQM